MGKVGVIQCTWLFPVNKNIHTNVRIHMDDLCFVKVIRIREKFLLQYSWEILIRLICASKGGYTVADVPSSIDGVNLDELFQIVMS